MGIDLAGRQNGISERFAPDVDRGRLIEAEHVARYRWAAQAMDGRTVLDAACGTAYGSRLLALGGAREVVGIDIAEPVLDAVAAEMPATVSLRPGDLRRLDLEDDRFDAVVCFEAIEHVDDPGQVLDELCRVLTPGGLLLISSPNRGVYPTGNPHHRHELSADELEAQLRDRLAHVRLFRQEDYLASAVLGDKGEQPSWEPPTPQANKGLYLLAAASDAELPPLTSVGELAGTLDLEGWLSALSAQDEQLADRDTELHGLRTRLGEVDRVAAALTGAEQRLAVVPELELRIAELEGELGRARAAELEARTELGQLDMTSMYLRRALRFVRPYIGLLKKLRRALRDR